MGGNFSTSCTQQYCNGDTWDGCVRANGSKWCQDSCRNVGPNHYCNGDTWAGCVRANGQDWCQNNCKDRSNNLYKVGCSKQGFTNVSKHNNKMFIYLILIIILALIIWYITKEKSA